MADLDRAVQRELSSLSKDHAAEVGAHLAAVSLFLETDPERAWRHAVAARRRAARLGVVRETAGLAAYRSERYAEALNELRTARRLTGSSQHLPVMADAERGLGRPERALELARDRQAQTLDAPARVELLIVEAGARQDLGQASAAVLTLQVKELDSAARTPSVARLRYAYASALERDGRQAEAVEWFRRARYADRDGTALPDDGVDPHDPTGEVDDEIIDLLGDGDEAEA